MSILNPVEAAATSAVTLLNMELESTFEMASYSLSQLEGMSYSARKVIPIHAHAVAYVFGHWKNFKLHYLYFQNLEAKPFRRSIALLNRLHALFGKDVPIHIRSDIKQLLASKRSKLSSKRQRVSFSNFYLGMLQRDIKSGKV